MNTVVVVARSEESAKVEQRLSDSTLTPNSSGIQPVAARNSNDSGKKLMTGKVAKRDPERSQMHGSAFEQASNACGDPVFAKLFGPLTSLSAPYNFKGSEIRIRTTGLSDTNDRSQRCVARESGIPTILKSETFFSHGAAGRFESLPKMGQVSYRQEPHQHPPRFLLQEFSTCAS